MNAKKVACVLEHSTKCPAQNGPGSPHVGGKIITGSTTVFVNSKQVAYKGSTAQCQGPPDTVISGSSSVFIESSPIASQFDKTAHGGFIKDGSENVFTN